MRAYGFAGFHTLVSTCHHDKLQGSGLRVPRLLIQEPLSPEALPLDFKEKFNTEDGRVLDMACHPPAPCRKAGVDTPH